MKTNWLVGSVILAGTMVLHAQTNDLSAALQKGLFEEEANRNLDAAISSYQALAMQFDQDRQIAATAIFRLGECYRKLGRTNDAVVQYQRILRDFPDQQTLATLSQQNLTGLGVTSQPRFQERLQAVIKKNPQDSIAPATSESAAKASELEAEVVLLKAQLAHLSGLKGEDRWIAVQQNFPNPVLTTLIQQLAEAEQKLASLTNEYALGAVPVVNATALVNTINGQIDAQVDGVVKGLQAKMEADIETAEMLRAQAKSASSVGAESPRTTDDEDREIRRIQQLIQNSPDLINAPSGDDQLTPLCRAAINDQLRVATFLMNNGANVNLKTNGKTPLHYAANGGHKRMVDLLLGRGADVNAKDGADRTALQLALERNYPAVAETLLAAKADANASDIDGNTPLTAAVKNDNYKLAAAMLALGANPNLQNKILPGQPGQLQGSGDLYGTALHLAAARNNAAMVALLLTNHADVKVRNIADWTPLDVAASAGATEVASQLIAAGADVNAAGPVNSTGGATPLLRATGNDHSETVKLLLEHGANPDAAYITGAGSTPLMLAAGQGNTEIAGLLVAHGARMDLKDNEHNTALYRAVNRGNVKVVQLLLAHGANPNERNPNGIPLLIVVTADKSNPDLLAAFLKARIDVNAADSSGQTALYYAVRDGRKDLAEMLLTAGADPNLRSHDGQTPLDLAKRQSASSGPDSIRRLPGVPSAPLSHRWRNGSTAETQAVPSASLADLLRQHGALDDLPDFNSITVCRPSTNSTYVIFRKGTNNWNRFTLLELIGEVFGFVSTDYSRYSDVVFLRQWDWNHKELRFPDFHLVTIQRAVPGVSQRKTINVDVESLLQSGDCSDDVTLQWGDRVEIPEADHPVYQDWAGLDANQITTLAKCVSRNVTLIIKGATNSIAIGPYFRPWRSDVKKPWVPGVEFPRQMNGSVWYDSYRDQMQEAAGCFMLTAALRGSGMLRASSDLTRVKVTRRDAKTGKKIEWVLDCSGDHAPDLWLRDGDVIEVPEK